jgi:hypothetical protein
VFRRSEIDLKVKVEEMQTKIPVSSIRHKMLKIIHKKCIFSNGNLVRKD